MSESPRQRTRDKIRGLFGVWNRLPDRTTLSRSAGLPSPGTASPAEESSASTHGQRFLELALQKLAPDERETVLEYRAAGKEDITSAIARAYGAALSKQQACQSNRWRWSFRGKEIVLRNEAEKVLRGLDRFKSIGDVVANVDPLHVGLPWAGIRVILEMTVTESRQMAALLTGMRLTFSMANRLEVYFAYYQRLPTMLATDNLEQALLQMYAHVLRFIATAIQTYQRCGTSRLCRALWETSVIEDFEKQCDNLGARAEIEASNCNRELSALDREKAKEWKAELELALQKLASVARIGDAVDDLHVRINLDKLRTASGATYDSHADEHVARCLAGTRTNLLDQVAAWAEGPKGKNIFWLCGKAGTGKSTIARTVATRLDKQGLLGASFFFNRGEGDRGNASRFFPTLALQFTRTVPEMGRLIAEALDADSLLCERRLQNQFERLLYHPFLNATQHGKARERIIVIDALDECDRQEDVRMILRLLARVDSASKTSLLVFVTSRPETPIQTGFRGIDGALHEDVMLEEVQISTIEHDIRLYLRHRFQEIREQYALSPRYNSLPAQWPKDDRIEALVSLAVPLFIFAFTVCRFISQRDPQGRLESLLQPRYSTALSGLNRMYATILEKMLLDQDVDEHHRALDDFRTIVGSIALLFDPLSADSLANILDVSLIVIDETLQSLHSVLHVPASSASPIRLLHLSFREFLINKQMQSSNKFHIDEDQTHARLAQQCTQRLSQCGVLSNDICKITLPGARRAEFSTDRVAACLPPDVAYACCYWALHTIQSKQELFDEGHVHKFLQRHFLHWLEALSWLGRVSSAIGFVSGLRLNAKGLLVSEFLEDAHRFLLRNRQIIDIAPLQTYHSALVFAPVESVIRRSFVDSASEIFSLLPTVPLQWSAEIQRLEEHDAPVTAVAFSPNGRVVASTSEDLTIRLWNPETGEQIKRLKTNMCGHAIAFSTDSQILTLLSFQKNEARMQIWNTYTGEQVQDSGTRKGLCMVVAFSPNGQAIAIASDSQTVRLCDTESGQQIHLLEGDFFIVTALTFLLDGRSLASGCMNGTIRLWDVQSGIQTHKLSGHKGRITRMVPSAPDGRTMASASNDRTLRMWNVSTGEQEHMFSVHDGHVTALAFSPDSKVLAFALNDQTVRVWHTASGEQILKIRQDDCCLDPFILPKMACSPIDRLLAVAVRDQTVQLWNTWTGEQMKALNGHTHEITALAFFPDGATLSSSSLDQTIRLWDILTGKEKMKIEAYATQFAFSSDGEMMATASKSTVQLWNPHTGEQLHTLGHHTQRIFGLTFLALDGYVVASFADDSTTRVWDAQTGERMLELRGHQSGTNFTVLSPDARLVATGADDGTVRLWNAYTGDMRHHLRGHDTELFAVGFSRDGQFVASISCDRSTQIWNTETGNQVVKLRIAEDDESFESFAIACSPDGQLVAISLDGTVQLQRAQTAEDIQKFTLHESHISAIAFSPDGDLLAIAFGRTVVLWNILAAQQTQRLEGHSDHVSAISFSPDGQTIASASVDSTVLLWDTKFDTKMQKFGGHDREVTAIVFSPGGQIAASASTDRTIQLWDVSSGEMRQKLEGHSDTVRALDFAPNDFMLASASVDRTVRLWDVQTGKQAQILTCHDAAAAVVFSPDGQIVVSANAWYGPVQLWNAQTGEQVQKLGREERFTALAFSPNSQFVAIVSDAGRFGWASKVEVWNAQTGEQLGGFAVVENFVLGAVCFSPDNQTVVAAGESGLLLWNAQTGMETQRLYWPPGYRKPKLAFLQVDFPTWLFKYRRPVFSKDRKGVKTPAGTFTLNWTSSASLLEPLERTVDLELTDQWIRYRGQDLLYLPHEYRGKCSDTCGDALVIGQASGAVTFFRLGASPE